jgi:hypothetical protein
LWPVSYLMRKSKKQKLDLNYLIEQIFFSIELDNNLRNETFIEKDNYDKAQIRRHQQRIAEQYWKEKHINENGISKLTFWIYD